MKRKVNAIWKGDGADGNGKSLTRSCYNCETWNEAVATPSTI